MIVEQNSRGRIYIDTFELKKLTSDFVNENYRMFEAIEVKVSNPNMHVTLRVLDEYRIEVLNDIRSDILEMLKLRVHLDIKQLDITIL